MPPFTRDPVSEWFDRAAWRLLERAYENPRRTAVVYLAPPTPGQWAMLGALRIDPMAKDRWGEFRWVRAFKRSVFHTANFYGGTRSLRSVENIGAGSHGWHAPIRVEWSTGARVKKAGWPSRRWEITVSLHPSSEATSLIGLDQPFAKRWIDDDGHATRRQSTIKDHTWEPA